MKSKAENFFFVPLTASLQREYTSPRAGETRLGEEICPFEKIETFTGKYVILGIAEDTGPQSNGGLPGAEFAFDAFLKKFLSMQSNRFLGGKEIAVLGKIAQKYMFTDIQNGRRLVSELDDFVVEVLQPYVERGLIPIVIGGGHNNAYPLIRMLSTVKNQPLNVINCDPHADFRPLEGRHSGNPFSTAFYEGFLGRYSVLGLHQSYNSRFILDELEKHGFPHTFFDDYILHPESFRRDTEHFFSEMQFSDYGIELDIDAISGMPSSAFTPSGLTVEDARFYVRTLAASPKVCYLHLPEGAPKSPVEETLVGKTLAYLVTDFVKAHASAE